VILGVSRRVADQVTPKLEALGCNIINPWLQFAKQTCEPARSASEGPSLACASG